LARYPKNCGRKKQVMRPVDRRFDAAKRRKKGRKKTQKTQKENAGQSRDPGTRGTRLFFCVFCVSSWQSLFVNLLLQAVGAKSARVAKIWPYCGADREENNEAARPHSALAGVSLF